MSFANTPNGLHTKPIDKTKLVFGENLRSQSDRLRKILLGEDGSGSQSNASIMRPLLEDGGIIFDYTPNISVTYNATYTDMDIAHSNYQYQSYSKGNFSELILKVDMTSETTEQADKTLAIIHFLRTYTKMNFGVQDELRGLPPRILRLYAYGDYMFNNVPVVVRSFNLAFEENIDYVHTTHNTQVPLHLSTSINLMYMPTPSRVKDEFSLSKFASGSLTKRGYI